MLFLRDTAYSFIVTTILMGLLVFQSSAFAQVRSSSNYQIESDSINAGGGLSSSALYGNESTVGEVATGRSTSTSFLLQAGYQQLDAVFVSLTGGADILLSPDLPGLTGGISTGSTTFTVVTDSPTGYQVTLSAAGAPAMQRADGVSIANYNNGAVADFAFTIPTASAVFGFSPEGVDVVDTFLDNSTTCGTGTTDTLNACWAGASTTAVTIVESTSSNQPTGATTTLRFQVGIANGGGVESGIYKPKTTKTALPL